MEKERLAEYLEQYHMGTLNAATSRELELTFGIKGIQADGSLGAISAADQREQHPSEDLGDMMSAFR